MAKHFYDPIIAHFTHHHADPSQTSAHGLFSMAEQMKSPEKIKAEKADKDKRCCFLDDIKKLMHLH